MTKFLKLAEILDLFCSPIQNFENSAKNLKNAIAQSFFKIIRYIFWKHSTIVMDCYRGSVGDFFQVFIFQRAKIGSTKKKGKKILHPNFGQCSKLNLQPIVTLINWFLPIVI